MLYEIAIVDDEPWGLTGVRTALDWQSCGFCIVIESFTPYEALLQVLDKRPHLIMLDINMPGLSGLDFIRRCHNVGYYPHFIIVSAHESFSYAKTAISLGVSEYLLKPIEKAELRFAIENIKEKLTHGTEPNSSLSAEAVQNQDFERLLHYIDLNYCEELSLSMLSQKFFFTNTYICDLFKQKLGTTFTRYINDLRLKKAYQLLQDSDMNISTIAIECGFGNSSYFTKLFREKYSILPNVLRTK